MNLYKYKDLLIEKCILETEIEKLQESITCISAVDYSFQSSNTNTFHSSTENTVIQRSRIIKLENQVEETDKQMKDIEKSILNTDMTTREKMILWDFHIKQRQIVDISRDLKISPTRCRQIKNKAERKVEK